MLTININTGYGLVVKKCKVENIQQAIELLNNKSMTFTVYDKNKKVFYKNF